jgi:hypothetical protein
MRQLQDKGWVQLTFGSEFIERSYVVGLSPVLARKGANYEGASKDVYFDEKQQVYWRETGSFD